MLMPKHESTEPLVRSLTQDPHHSRMILMLDITLSELQVPKATILVVDRKNSVVMELRDDSKTPFDEAIGFSTYSDKNHPNPCQIRSAVRIFYAISCRLVQNALISLDYSI
jgi:hypothetical protein